MLGSCTATVWAVVLSVEPGRVYRCCAARTVMGRAQTKGMSVVGSSVRFESHTVIEQPVAVVFERLADLPGYRGWMHRTGLFRRSGLTSEAPIGVGTTYFDSTWMGTFEGEVTEFMPPSRLAFRETLHWFGSGVSQARPEYLLDVEDGATVVHHIAVGELYGWMRLMKPAAALMARVERTRTLQSLKQSLESK